MGECYHATIVLPSRSLGEVDYALSVLPPLVGEVHYAR